MGKRLLTERMTFTGGRVVGTDEAPVVEGVLLCGAVSANRRRYLKAAFEGERVKRYNGVPVGTYHTRDDGHKYLEEIGLIRNARHNSAGLPIGDIHVNPEKLGAKAFLWDARNAPEACAMSHVANCETVTSRDGWEDVTEVVKVESVDVIGAGKAATAKTLFSESKKGRNVPQISLRKFVERFGPKMGPAKWGAANKVCEDIGGMADVPAIEEPPADASEGDLKTALMSALTPLLDEAFESGNSDKACSALRDFIKLHAKHTGQAGGGSPTTDTSTDTDTEESRKRPDSWTVLKECQDADYSPGTTELQMLASQPDAALRASYIREQKAKTARVEPVKSAPRKPGADVGKKVEEAKAVPTDAKGYANSIRD